MLRLCASHITILGAPTDSLGKHLGVVKAAGKCHFAVGTEMAKVAVSIRAVSVNC